MKSTRKRIVIALSFLITIGFSIPAHSEAEGSKQEALGKAIQESAVLKQQESLDQGGAQERLGQVIQEAAQSSHKLTAQDGKFQEQLGRQIQDAAVLQYAQGRTQEKIAQTILQMVTS